MRKTFIGAIALTAVMALILAQARAEDKAALKIGSKAPDFSLQDQTGKTVNLSDYTGKIVVLEWFNEDCPFVVRHYEKDKTMATLAQQYGDKGVVWLAVNSTKGKTNDTNKAIADKWSIQYPVLNDASGAVGKKYSATNTPQMFIIGKDGNLLYQGAIDDDQSGGTVDRANYVKKALDEILSGQTVSHPETKAYGCSVKYAS